MKELHAIASQGCKPFKTDKSLEKNDIESIFCLRAYTYGFGGHLRDDEVSGSGNHYSFGDYGLDTRLGRRWTLDPKSNKLPSWSPYAFGIDNPINVVDDDGLWPKWIHNRIIKMAFKDIMTAEQIKTLQKASAFVDRKENQKPEKSPEHYMSMPGQKPQDAAQESEQFIADKKEEFKSKEGDEALFALGEGMHTIMDKTSPSHNGSQVWEGTSIKKPGSYIKALGHIVKELNLFRKDEGKVKQAAENIKEYYEQAVTEKKTTLSSAGFVTLRHIYTFINYVHLSTSFRRIYNPALSF